MKKQTFIITLTLAAGLHSGFCQLSDIIREGGNTVTASAEAPPNTWLLIDGPGFAAATNTRGDSSITGTVQLSYGSSSSGFWEGGEIHFDVATPFGMNNAAGGGYTNWHGYYWNFTVNEAVGFSFVLSTDYAGSTPLSIGASILIQRLVSPSVWSTVYYGNYPSGSLLLGNYSLSNSFDFSPGNYRLQVGTTLIGGLNLAPGDEGTLTYNFIAAATSAVPEPHEWGVTMAAGLLLIVALRRKKQNSTPVC